jgi:hypothetical protein
MPFVFFPVCECVFFLSHTCEYVYEKRKKGENRMNANNFKSTPLDDYFIFLIHNTSERTLFLYRER